MTGDTVSDTELWARGVTEGQCEVAALTSVEIFSNTGCKGRELLKVV